jgi:hypothetical protein
MSFLSTAMAVFKTTLWLVRSEDKHLNWEFSSPLGLNSLLIIRTVADTVAVVRDRFDGPLQPGVRIF